MNKYFTPAIYFIVFVLLAIFLVRFLPVPYGIVLALFLALLIAIIPYVVLKPEYAVTVMAFLLPFERIPSIEIGGANLKINHIVIVVLGLALLIRSSYKKLSGREMGPIGVAVLLFFGSILLSIPQAVNLGRSFRVAFFVALMVLIYFSVYKVIENKRILNLVIKGLIWGGIVAGAMGLFQFFGDMVGLPIEITLLKEGYDKSTFGFARVQAFSQEPLYFANYIFIPLFVGIALLIKKQAGKIINEKLIALMVVILGLNFILSLSRGAFLAGIVGFGLLAVLQFKKIFRARIMIPAIFLIVLVIAGAGLALMKSESGSLQRFISHAGLGDRGTSESWVSRFDATEEAYRLFRQSPIVGIGLGNFGPVTQGNPEIVPEGGWHIVNNEYMELLAENGVVGVSMFILLIVLILTRSIKAYRKTKDDFEKAVSLGLGLAFLSILVQYLTFSTIYIIHIWFLMALIASSSHLILSNNNEK